MPDWKWRPTDHNHTSDTDSDSGGPLTNDDHDGYSQYDEIVAPSTPNSGKVRLYAKDVAGISTLYYMDDSGAEFDLSQAGGSGAPDNASYIVEDSHVDLTAESVLGTTVITTTAYASQQAAAKAGRIHLPTDGYTIERDSGSAWQAWGPIFKFTKPVLADFAWINQGSATATQEKGGIWLTTPADASVNEHIIKKTAPATPYTITIAFIPLFGPVASPSCGPMWRESGSGKLASFNLYSVDEYMQIQVQKFTNATTWSATYSTLSFGIVPSSVIFMRIADDGANRICSISYDGQHFLQLHSVGRTDFLTPDEVGFMFMSQQASYATGINLLSWLEA